MEPEARYSAIGAVLLVLLLSIAAGTVWLMRTGGLADSRQYTVYFEHQSLEGLQVGSPVEMRGIPVGRVERLTIPRENINRVRVTLRVDGKALVRVNTVAAVERKLLTGLARIALDTPGTPGRELTELPRGETYPVIAEGESTLEHVSDELMATVASIHSMSRAMEAAAGDLAQSGKQLAAAAQTASAAARPAANQATQTLRDISRAAQAFEQEFRVTAEQLRSSAEVVSRAAERLDDPRALLFGPAEQQLGPGEKLR